MAFSAPYEGMHVPTAKMHTIKNKSHLRFFNLIPPLKFLSFFCPYSHYIQFIGSMEYPAGTICFVNFWILSPFESICCSSCNIDNKKRKKFHLFERIFDGTFVLYSIRLM